MNSGMGTPLPTDDQRVDGHEHAPVDSLELTVADVKDHAYPLCRTCQRRIMYVNGFWRCCAPE